MNFIDKIIYINLDIQPLKRERIELELTKYGLEYQRFGGYECKEFGAYGCGISHLFLLKHAKACGYKNVLILEDDFYFTVDKDTFEKQIQDLFTLKPDFDICCLSYNLNRYSTTEYDFLYKILESQTTAGYIIQQHYYDTLIELYEWAMPMLLETRKPWIYACDMSWKILQENGNWYCFKNRTGHQLSGFSDVGQQYSDNTLW
jgi:GR25 family glycosyltransferase involved in LPS biosynthesis